MAVLLVFATGCSALLGFDDGELVVDVADAGGIRDDAPSGTDASDATRDALADALVDASADALADAPADAPIDALVDAGPKQAFETSAAFNGRLDASGVPGAGGVAAGDQRCMEAAQGTFPGRTFVAWLSTAAVPAPARLVGGGPWYVGQTLLGDTNDLKTGKLRTPLDRDPDGVQIAASPLGVWTGTDDVGASSLTCSDWSTPLSNASGEVGTTGGAGGNWTYGVTRTCNLAFHLYCFEK